MKKYLDLIRVKHWIKNSLLFVPLFFSNNLFDWSKNIKLLISFFAFSLICSSIYIFNDLSDIEKDKKHPQKKNRPIASGKISKNKAIIIFVILFIFSLSINIITNGFGTHLLYLLLYFFINILYSKILKNIPIIDVSVLSFGFLIRIFYGSSIILVEVSNWLYLTILAMSYFLGLGKRRNELQKIEKNSGSTRKVLEYYIYEFLDKNMYLCLTLAIVFYAMWCVDPALVSKQPYIIYTVPIIILICMKYSLTIESDSFGDPVEVLLKDKILISLIAIYIMVMFVMFYGMNIVGFFAT